MVISDCVNASFGVLSNQLLPLFYEDGNEEGKIVEAVSRNVPLAGILPTLSKSCKCVLGEPMYVDVVANHASLKTLGVLVYSGWE